MTTDTQINGLQELVTIDSAPAKLDANFEEVQRELDRHLANYDTVVTADGVKEAKAAATEINQLRQAIRSRVKDAVDLVSAPIADFRSKGKALEDRCEDARQALLTQVKKFEDETRELCEHLLSELVAAEWDRHDVEPEHRCTEVADLVKISNVTATGNLSKAAQDAVRERVAADKARQDKVRMRLLELENRSYKAGLSAPLTRDHVHQWLQADDETYEAQLQRILDAEVTRQEQAEQRMREKVEREQRQQAEREAAEQARRERQQNDTPRAEPPSAPSPVQSAPASDETPSRPAKGRVQVEITCRFVTEIPEHISDERLESELRKKLTAAGLNSLDSVAIARRAKAA